MTAEPDRLDRARAALAQLQAILGDTLHRPGRYVRHDLLQAYAAELTARLDDDRERVAPTRRWPAMSRA